MVNADFAYADDIEAVCGIIALGTA